MKEDLTEHDLIRLAFFRKKYPKGCKIVYKNYADNKLEAIMGDSYIDIFSDNLIFKPINKFGGCMEADRILYKIYD